MARRMENTGCSVQESQGLWKPLPFLRWWVRASVPSGTAFLVAGDVTAAYNSADVEAPAMIREVWKRFLNKILSWCFGGRTPGIARISTAACYSCNGKREEGKRTTGEDKKDEASMSARQPRRPRVLCEFNRHAFACGGDGVWEERLSGQDTTAELWPSDRRSARHSCLLQPSNTCFWVVDGQCLSCAGAAFVPGSWGACGQPRTARATADFWQCSRSRQSFLTVVHQSILHGSKLPSARSSMTMV